MGIRSALLSRVPVTDEEWAGEIAYLAIGPGWLVGIGLWSGLWFLTIPIAIAVEVGHLWNNGGAPPLSG